MIRILVADDHAVVRRGLTEVLGDPPDFLVVGEAASGTEVLALAVAVPADVCILDLAMPGGGPELIARLRGLRPTLRILAFTTHPEAPYAVACLTAGASGYLGKRGPIEDLEHAVRTVHAGRRFITDEVAELLVSHVVDGPDGSLHDRLSAREYDVLCRLARGETTGEIAIELGISVKTVSTYRSRVLQKMGLTRNAELTRYAVDHGLID